MASQDQLDKMEQGKYWDQASRTWQTPKARVNLPPMLDDKHGIAQMMQPERNPTDTSQQTQVTDYSYAPAPLSYGYSGGGGGGGGGNSWAKDWLATWRFGKG